MSESRGFFQILTHGNYEKTNPIRIFYKRPMQGILQQKTFFVQNFLTKPKYVRIWSFMNIEGNNLLIDVHRHKLISFFVGYCDRCI